MTNEQIAQQMAEMQAQLAALQKENQELKSRPASRGGFDPAEPVRIIKTGTTKGKIQVKYKTMIDLNALQALMIAAKLPEIIETVKRFRHGKFRREMVMRKDRNTGTYQRQPWDDLIITNAQGEELHCGTVAIAKDPANNPVFMDNHPENVKNLQDRIDRWNELWAEIDKRTARTR